MSTDADALLLIDVMRELRERYGVSVAYNSVWKAVAEGQVPACRVRGRWRIAREDVPAVATALRLTPPASPVAA